MNYLRHLVNIKKLFLSFLSFLVAFSLFFNFFSFRHKRRIKPFNTSHKGVEMQVYIFISDTRVLNYNYSLPPFNPLLIQREDVTKSCLTRDI